MISRGLDFQFNLTGLSRVATGNRFPFWIRSVFLRLVLMFVPAPLIRTAQSDANNITVDVDGTKVILKGTVRSCAERKEAERQAWAAPGVTSVDNRITI